jgi:hypothetical protein
MNKIFLSNLLLFSVVFTNPPKILNTTSIIGTNISPKAAIVIDFKSRLNKAEQELKNAKSMILNELNSTEKELNDFIKKNHSLYENCFAEQIAKYKKENKYFKLAKFSEEISAELQKNPTIEIFAIDNLFGKYGSPGITIGQTIFLDSKFVDKPGIIMHEICHAINEDQIMISALDAFIDQHNKNTRNSKLNKLADFKTKFYHKMEKRADLWSASHGKDFAKQLSDFFKSLKCASTECHPALAERIGYLS